MSSPNSGGTAKQVVAATARRLDEAGFAGGQIQMCSGSPAPKAGALLLDGTSVDDVVVAGSPCVTPSRG